MNSPVALLLRLALAGFLAAPLLSADETPSDKDVNSAPAPASVTPPGMSFVPAGTLAAGLTPEQIQALNISERAGLKLLVMSSPQHSVQLPAFFLDTTEVTNAQWQAYLDATGREPSEKLVQFYWKEGKIPEGHEQFPISCVAYDEAAEFARWAMKRLPTEYEWEYAARGAAGNLYPWGDSYDTPADGGRAVSAGERANCADTSGKRGPRAVGSFPEGKSPFGVLDLAGNVWEWTASPALPYPGYKPLVLKTFFNKQGEEIDAAEFISRDSYIVRGGAFDRGKESLLAALRQPTIPGTRLNTLGFRCARSTIPGRDMVQAGIEVIGAFHFRDYSIDLDQSVAIEAVDRTPEGLIRETKHLAFAPVGKWEKLSDVTSFRKTNGRPVVAGLLSLDTEVKVPLLPPGVYKVAFHAANKKAKVEGEFPETGWIHAGLPKPEPKGAKAEARRKAAAKARGKAKEEPQEPPAEGEEAAEGEEPAEVDPEANPVVEVGSIEYDLRHDNLVIVNRHNQVVAALPIDAPRDSAKFAAASLERKEPSAVARKKGAGESVTISFVVPTGSNNRGVAFTLPLELAPNAFAFAPAAAAAEPAPAGK